MNRWRVGLLGAVASCSVEDPTPDPSCEGPLFGAPTDATGLAASQCVPALADWTPPRWDPARVAALRDWTLLDPPAAPTDDPYDDPVSPPPPDLVCAVDVVSRSDRTYRLVSAPVADAPGPITHGGACGLCSSLADLAVYAENADLTAPVRECGFEGFSGGVDAVAECLEDLGFTPPCARIWAYNAEHTREVCLDVCLDALDAPYHTPDGALNPCLQCDEDLSGPVFQAVAGRTRRNTGIPNALCRPCDTVWRIEHRIPGLPDPR